MIILVLQDSRCLSDIKWEMNYMFLMKQKYFFNHQIFTSYMGVSISRNYESRIIFTYFYIIVLSVIEWMENNHVGLNVVNFCKLETLNSF